MVINLPPCRLIEQNQSKDAKSDTVVEEKKPEVEETATKYNFLYPAMSETVQISSKISLVEVLFCKMGCDTISVQSAGLSLPGRA